MPGAWCCVTQWNFRSWIMSELVICNVELSSKQKIKSIIELLSILIEIFWPFCSWQNTAEFDMSMIRINIYIYVKDLRPAYSVTWRQTWLQVCHFLLALLASVLKSHHFLKMPPRLAGNPLLGLQEINSNVICDYTSGVHWTHFVNYGTHKWVAKEKHKKCTILHGITPLGTYWTGYLTFRAQTGGSGGVDGSGGGGGGERGT